MKLTIDDQVIYGAQRSLAREMGAKLKRSSFSSIIRESDDYGAALVSSDFILLAEAETTPLQMGPLANYCKGLCELLKERGEELDPDGVYLHNDPYHGASHSPDIAAITPLFVDNKLFMFVGTVAHHVDLGAGVPGTCIIEAHDAYSEGISLRAMPIELEGKSLHHHWRFIEDNVRMSHMVVGDLKAQVASVKWGKERLKELVHKYGKEHLLQASHRLVDIAEERMRRKIQELPDGVYEAFGLLDGYEGTENVDIPLKVSLTIKGDSIDVDLTGSAPQLDHAPINMPFYGTTDMAILLTLRTLLLPETKEFDLPHNGGLFKPISLFAPLGSIANPLFPAPTIGRFCAGQLLSNLVVLALSPILPKQVCAGCSPTKAITFSGRRKESGKPWVYMDITEGAYGATYDQDGLDAVDILYANTKNNPIEDIELHYPLRVEKYELREGSGGKGLFRGGDAPVRETRLLEEGHLSVEGDGFRHKPWGLFGGEAGETGGVQIITPTGKASKLASKINNISLEKGTLIRDICPSGGGYGHSSTKE